QHGLNLFAHLRGMYAFALWDANHDRLVLAVDHIGMKPLYLCERGGMLRFASEVKAILDGEAALNLDALDTYLSFGFMVGDDTLFDGIRRLPPGHALIAEDGSVRLHEHWRFGVGTSIDEQPESEGQVIERARDLLAESVRLHL